MRLNVEQIKLNKQDDAGQAFAFSVNMRSPGGCAKVQGGFSLVELVTVIVIIGILAVAALPRFFDKNVFDSRGFYDQVISTLRFAQKTAIAQRRLVCVTFAASSVALTVDSATPPDGACDPAPAGDLISTTGQPSWPRDVTFAAPVAGTVFSFDGLGRPSATPPILINGYPTPITVEAETGYVH